MVILRCSSPRLVHHLAKYSTLKFELANPVRRLTVVVWVDQQTTSETAIRDVISVSINLTTLVVTRFHLRAQWDGRVER